MKSYITFSDLIELISFKSYLLDKGYIEKISNAHESRGTNYLCVDDDNRVFYLVTKKKAENENKQSDLSF